MDVLTEKDETKICVTDWPTMSLSELYNQKIILNNRIQYAMQIKNNLILNGLQHGLIDIEYHISKKLNEENSNAKNIIT